MLDAIQKLATTPELEYPYTHKKLIFPKENNALNIKQKKRAKSHKWKGLKYWGSKMLSFPQKGALKTPINHNKKTQKLTKNNNLKKDEIFLFFSQRNLP